MAIIKQVAIATTIILVGALTACGDDSESATSTPNEPASNSDEEQASAKDPAKADAADVDRFAEGTGTLFVRTPDNGLPAANAPIDFDEAPFLTLGLSPEGAPTYYYNFDVQPTAPAPIYVFFKDGETTPVPGQLNVIDVIPGEEGYNDFWLVNKVTVPDDYVANSITSLEEIEATEWTVEALDKIVNCPVVPEGSTAEKRLGEESTELVTGWYQGKTVKYFEFAEAEITGSAVPVSPIYVTFNLNPDEDGGGPASGFMTEDGSAQTHNVLETLPGDDGYSPMWLVSVLDNADFDSVTDLESANDANVLASGIATVNCPIVAMDEKGPSTDGKDPAAADVVEVDRFAEGTGMLFVRTDENELPAANAAIDFDETFLTLGLSPAGTPAYYYNFDVQSTEPAPIYVFFKEGEDTPVEGQLNVIDVIPGDSGYNDFWQVNKVTVPADYVPNSVTSLDEIEAAEWEIEPLDKLVNCPVVPDGSTATKRIGDGGKDLVSGWYKGDVVKYFEFAEAEISGSSVPLSPIYVMFNLNPDEDGGGPPSGFMTEEDSPQTHNVLETLPGDDGYSPMWLVNILDNADFDSVSDLETAQAATILAPGAANVNCPIVAIED